MVAEIDVYVVSNILEPSSALLFGSYHFESSFFSWPSLLTPSTMLEVLGPWPGGARSLARSSLRVLCNIVEGEAGRGDCVHFEFNFHLQSWTVVFFQFPCTVMIIYAVFASTCWSCADDDRIVFV